MFDFELRSRDRDRRVLPGLAPPAPSDAHPATAAPTARLREILQTPLWRILHCDGAAPQESLEASERLAAEPRIRSNRAQRKIFRPFLKIDLMDPNRTRPVRQQDLLGEGLLLG